MGRYERQTPASGVLAALRASDRAGKLVVVGYELMDNVTAALLDGTITLPIAHPLARLAAETITGMTRAITSNGDNASYTRIVPFDIYTRENL